MGVFGNPKGTTSPFPGSVERVSVIITTNVRFADWNSIFGDGVMTSSLLDRLTSRGDILECVGESYRFRQRAQMEEQGLFPILSMPACSCRWKPRSLLFSRETLFRRTR
jgi:hypothetical protein